MNDVDVSYLKEDVRPPFVMNDVKGVDFYRLKAQHAAGLPTLVLKDIENFSIQQSWPLSDLRLERVDIKKL